MSGRKLRKSIWVPLCLAIYCAAMTFAFARRLLEDGQAVKLWISVGVECLVLIALFFALRRKEKLANYWEKTKKKEHESFKNEE